MGAVEATERLGLVSADDVPALFVDYAKWYKHPIVVRPFGQKIVNGRYAALRHVGRQDRLFGPIGGYNSAAPATDDVSGLPVKAWDNATGLSKGYKAATSLFNAVGTVNKIVVGGLFKLSSPAGTAVYFSAYDTATLLGVNITGSTVSANLRGVAADSQVTQTAQHEQFSGSAKANTWNSFIAAFDYAGRTVECSNLIRTRATPTAMTGTDVRPAAWTGAVQITIGNNKAAGNPMIYQDYGATVFINPTDDEIDDLITELVAARNALNA